jgi:hypothetical protein
LNFNFNDASKPTFTSPHYLPPTKIERCRENVDLFPNFCITFEVEQSKRSNKCCIKYLLPDCANLGIEKIDMENLMWYCLIGPKPYYFPWLFFVGL